jgi:hypothetical protein
MMSAALLDTSLSASLPARPRGAAAAWTGRVLSGLVAAFLGVNATVGLLALPEAVEGTRALGLDPALLPALGVVQLTLLVLYLVPRTAPLGAVLWTGWLGGAIATHLRLGNPALTHLLFPLYVAVPLWLGLWLRDPRVRAVLGPRSR